MEDGVGFCSTRSSVDEDEDSDRARTDSLDGYASGSGSGNRSFTDKRRRGHSDPEHRKRRAIANSNERKRMQSINAGFNSLRNLVCPKSGDKLSKAAILKYTADFIKTLLAEKQQLLADNRCLEQLLSGTDLDLERHTHQSLSLHSLRPGKRRRREAESSSSDEGLGFTAAEEILVASGDNSNGARDKSISELRRQVKDLEEQVEKEKALRLLIEADKRQLELRPMALSDQQTAAKPIFDASNKNQTSKVIQLPGLHTEAWRRGLETIVEAIRHVEGEQGMFGSEEVSCPLQQISSNTNTTCLQLKAASPFESSLLLSQLHPACIRDLSSGVLSPVSLPSQICFTPSFHRPSLAAPSS